VGNRDLADTLVLIGYGACALMAFGSLAPWAEAGPVTSSGVDNDDGFYMLFLAAIGAAALWRWSQYPVREVLVGTVVVAAVALALGLYNASSLPIDGPGVSLGWGLILAIAGAAALFAIGGLLLARDRA
jgi:hypothetical protein